MTNFLKSLIPNTIFFIGSIIEYIGKALLGLAGFLQGVSVLLHMQLKTKLGVTLLEMQQQVNNIVSTFTAIQNKARENRESRKEDNKLADIVKNPTNVVQLGKKNDDDTKG